MKLLAFTNSEDVTVDIVLKNAPSSIQVARVDADKFFTLILKTDKCEPFQDVDVLWYRRPFEYFYERESASNQLYLAELEESTWSHLLTVPREKWVNFPSINWYAEKKISQLRAAKEIGLACPDWILSNDADSAQSFLEARNYACVIKPINCGYFLSDDSVYHVYTNEVRRDIDLSALTNCPTFFQQRINKQMDVRTVYVDGEALFVAIHGGQLDVRRDEMRGVSYEIINPPKQIASLYLLMMRHFELRFCTSDFVVDQHGNWFFLENNPNGNWVWMDEYLGGRLTEFFFHRLQRKQK